MCSNYEKQLQKLQQKNEALSEETSALTTRLKQERVMTYLLNGFVEILNVNLIHLLDLTKSMFWIFIWQETVTVVKRACDRLEQSVKVASEDAQAQVKDSLRRYLR
jgi:DNA-binding protein YbaB